MNHMFDEWERNSTHWKTQLEVSLTNHEGEDLVTYYKNVALAFPSRSPHPSTFEYPMIDESSLKTWAHEHGWEVIKEPESEPGVDSSSPPIRFKRV